MQSEKWKNKKTFQYNNDNNSKIIRDSPPGNFRLLYDKINRNVKLSESGIIDTGYS